MWKLSILIILYVSAGVKSNDYLKILLRSANDEFLGYIKKLQDYVQKFLQYNVDLIEKRSRTIGKAFHRFIKDAVADEVKYTTTEIIEGPRTRKNAMRSNFEELVAAAGYKSASHIVVTVDGYMLTLYRIMPLSSNITINRNRIVLLHHGLFGSSDDWILLGPKKGLPYLLVNAGYDVWLTNARGNKYSRSHARKNVNAKEFWNFSWHEVGQFDIAAVLDFIRERNANDVQINFIGYSMGATALMVLLSVLPQYNSYIKIAVLMAPLVLMHGVKGPLQLISQYYNSKTLSYFEIKQESPLKVLPSKLNKLFCENNSKLCHNPLLLLANGARKLNQNLESNILTYSPGGTSMKVLIHYIQLIKSGQFRMFNLGLKENFIRYGAGTPPTYALKNVLVPVALFSSSDDWLSPIADVEMLLSKLPNILMHHKIVNDVFGHVDFMWSDSANILVYHLLMDVLNHVNI